MGDDRELQRSLLRSMLVAGELSLAAEHQQQFGLDGEFEVHPEQLAEERERRRRRFLQLPLPAEAVRYVDSADGLPAIGAALAALLAPQHRHGAAHSPLVVDGEAPAVAASSAAAAATPAELGLLEAAAPAGAARSGTAPGMPAGSSVAAAAADRDVGLLPVLGMDLEWQPDSENSAPPSVLQISTGALPMPASQPVCCRIAVPPCHHAAATPAAWPPPPPHRLHSSQAAARM